MTSLKHSLPTLPLKRVERAYALASRLYGNRLLAQSKSMTLMEHVSAVLKIFLQFNPDEDGVIACILQHSLQCPDFSMQSLEQQFGRRVREIVSRLHLLSHLNTEDWRRSINDMKIMLVSVSDDVRVILLKLCVQSVLIENLSAVDAQYHMRLSRKCLRLYSPVAARLGIYAIKYRLEDHAFPVSYPSDAENIVSQLERLSKQHGSFLPEVVDELKVFFEQEGMQAAISAREKHPYSIFQKMQKKSVTGIDKIHDRLAIRVVVKASADCYQALGLLHRIATPISHRFKDYISFPKPNGYQSLHTCVIGLPGAPKNLMIEVQIRTEDMHREAEYGIAAHWMYKEKGDIAQVIQRLQLSDVLMHQQVVESKGQRAEGTGGHLVDHIYVLTPKGGIIELPKGSTPLDFAFAVHTDLGLKFKSARVNDVLVPLSTKLENGDIVEIHTHKIARPSLQWLDRMMSSSAKSKLKAYFFAHHRTQFIDRGKKALNSELRDRGMARLDTELTTLKTFDGKTQSLKEREDLLVKVGMGSVRTSSVFRHLSLPSMPRKRKTVAVPERKPRRSQLIQIEDGGAPMPYRFAKCCSADSQADKKSVPIVGFITRTGELSIHKEGCGMMRNANPERRVRVKWAVEK